jgi:hypothetical protein
MGKSGFSSCFQWYNSRSIVLNFFPVCPVIRIGDAGHDFKVTAVILAVTRGSNAVAFFFSLIPGRTARYNHFSSG